MYSTLGQHDRICVFLDRMMRRRPAYCCLRRTSSARSARETLRAFTSAEMERIPRQYSLARCSVTPTSNCKPPVCDNFETTSSHGVPSPRRSGAGVRGWTGSRCRLNPGQCFAFTETASIHNRLDFCLRERAIEDFDFVDKSAGWKEWVTSQRRRADEWSAPCWQGRETHRFVGQSTAHSCKG